MHTNKLLNNKNKTAFNPSASNKLPSSSSASANPTSSSSSPFAKLSSSSSTPSISPLLTTFDVDHPYRHYSQHHHSAYHHPQHQQTISNFNPLHNSSLASSIDLEPYLEAMEARTTSMDRNQETDVWAQLQQKESDILLAAELGKALLEKNEELVKQHEKLIEENSIKIEKLEQEKHVLRQKLAIAEEESEQRVLELQTDLNELKDKLQAQENAIRQAEKEKTLLIEELSSQNARLTEQIQEAHNTEMKLMAQIQELKDQYSYRNTSLQEHVNSLESIKTELNLTTEKRHELEKRLQAVEEEKQNLSAALDESSDRIHMLERHAREQETKLETTLQALERSTRENNVLSERLGADNYSGSTGKKSLQFEMECDEDEANFSEDGKPSQIWVESRSVYIQLKSLVDSLKISHDDDSGFTGLNSDISLDLESMDNTISSTSEVGMDSNGNTNANGSHAINFRPGMLSAMSDELTRLLLNLDAGNFKKMLDQTRNLVLEQEDEIKRSHQLIQQLEAKCAVTDVELQNVKEERDQARGDLVDNTDRDELLAKAQKERDNATERRTKAEVELAKTRVELMQANSQLLESIQQKVELSQQLEQWQMDMQELIEEQMRSKMINNRKTQADPQTNTGGPGNLAKRLANYKLWSLFQR
ncbi:bicaudal D-related protein homolog isoform X1 [Stomoxys calcitrans]|uniref:bicaudal D-related protein homolog isoform X1 n=2 Tax=Stomoxys calcitrans TaxID=35570 RepID=UPI0027E32891|nr:bicaudal D-related protein homolog isoform X1 [Stomoxys calcitrans]XP_013107242.2 bicaudal D-related protein homolog isoform X1 [Stomoxys calcitrans]